MEKMGSWSIRYYLDPKSISSLKLRYLFRGFKFAYLKPKEFGPSLNKSSTM